MHFLQNILLFQIVDKISVYILVRKELIVSSSSGAPFTNMDYL